MHTLARHIEAPNGYRDLQKGINYVYLGPAALSGRVLLCSFEPKRQRVHLYFPKRKHFEFGLKSRKIIESKRQHNYPAWLTATLQKESDPSLYGSITNYKLRHKKRVKKRYKRIKPLLKQAKTIFATADPSKPVKAYARRNSLNELRTCFDFFAVVAHAGSRWALLPLYDGNGTYERNIKKTSSRVGRKSQKHGADYGYPRTHKMNQKIYTGYDKYSGPGVSQKDIWRFTLVNVFGCQARMPDPTSRVQYEFFHPKGKDRKSVV